MAPQRQLASRCQCSFSHRPHLARPLWSGSHNVTCQYTSPRPRALVNASCHYSHPAIKSLITAQIQTFLQANPVTATLSRAARWDKLKVKSPGQARQTTQTECKSNPAHPGSSEAKAMQICCCYCNQSPAEVCLESQCYKQLAQCTLSEERA